MENETQLMIDPWHACRRRNSSLESHAFLSLYLFLFICLIMVSDRKLRIVPKIETFMNDSRYTHDEKIDTIEEMKREDSCVKSQHQR